MDKESLFLLQKVDCNCNDCKFMVRDFEKYRSYDHLYQNERGVVENPSYRVHYGNCSKLSKPVSFLPNTFQHDTQQCFEHRRGC